MANSPNCQRIAQGVARLSAFRLPPRRSEGALLLPLSADELRLVAQQPAQRQIPHNNGTPKVLRPLSNSSNLLHVSGGGSPAGGGRRMLSLDAQMARVDHKEWLNTQRFLAAEAAELRRRREQSCCASVGASYAFLALSVALSLSVVIAVCLFLHSFVPKDFQLRRVENGPKIIGGAMETDPFSANSPKMFSQLLGQNSDDPPMAMVEEMEMELFHR